MTKVKKSALVKQAERFFSFDDANLATQIPSAPNSTSPQIIQTFTTYSVCEDPIPDPRKKK